MLIKKKPPKKLYDPPKQLALFIEECCEASEENLANHLNSFQQWSYPRADLYHWASVLNRFDKIFEDLIKKYDIGNLQLNPFEENDKILLLAILRFTVFLMDHCANRSIYNSMDRLSELLYTCDFDVLHENFNVILRISKRSYAIGSSRNSLGIPHEKILKFSFLLPSSRIESENICQDFRLLISEGSNVPPEWGDLNYTFYRITDGGNNERDFQSTSSKMTKSQTSSRQDSKSMMDTGNSSVYTPIRQLPDENVSGLETIHKTHDQLERCSAEEMFKKLINQYDLKPEYRLPLLNQIRYAKYMFNPEMRKKFTIIRLMATASLIYITSDKALTTQILSANPDFITQIASVLSIDSNLDARSKIVAYYILTALMNHEALVTSIFSALNVSFSHGIIMSTYINHVQKIKLSDSQNWETEEFSALLDLLENICVSTAGGTMLCGAGIIQNFVSIINIREPGALRIVFRIIHLLDHMLYALNLAFNEFISQGGVGILVGRIEYEVDLDKGIFEKFENTEKHRSMNYSMTYERASCLKIMLKFVLHLMQSSGHTPELRNLIDSSLLSSLKIIFDNSEEFGSSIFALAINIVSSFLHSEPTCFAILAEKGIPAVLLAAAKLQLSPTKELFTALPNVFGAICLNNQGLELFEAMNPLDNYFNIFLNTDCAECLIETDSSGTLGSSIDELMRHHPALKATVMQNISKILTRIQNRAIKVFKRGRCDEDVYEELQRIIERFSNQDIDIDIEEVDEIENDYDGISFCINALSTFLEGLFANSQHLKMFIDDVGIVKILKVCLLNLMLNKSEAATKANNNILQVFRLFVEARPNETLDKLRKITWEFSSEILQYQRPTKEFVQFFMGEKNTANNFDIVTIYSGKLRALKTLVTMYSSFFLTNPYFQSRNSSNILASLLNSEESENILHELGITNRTCIILEIILCSNLPQDWIKATLPNNTEILENDMKSLNASWKFQRFSELRSSLTQISASVGILLQGLSLALVPKRITESSHKRIFVVARSIAFILRQSLELTPGEDEELIEKDLLKYRLVIIGLIKYIMTEDDYLVNSVQSLILLMLYENRGLDVLLYNFDQLWHWLELNINVLKEIETKVESHEGRILGAIKIILQFLLLATNSSLFNESVQCIALSFFPQGKHSSTIHHFYLKETIFANISRKLNITQLKNLPFSIMSPIIIILGQCSKKEDFNQEEIEFIKGKWYMKHSFFCNYSDNKEMFQSSEDDKNTKVLQELGIPLALAKTLLQNSKENLRLAIFDMWKITGDSNTLHEDYSSTVFEDDKKFIEFVSKIPSIPYTRDVLSSMGSLRQSFSDQSSVFYRTLLQSSGEYAFDLAELTRAMESEKLFLQFAFKSFEELVYDKNSQQEVSNILHVCTILLSDLFIKGEIVAKEIQIDWELLLKYVIFSKDEKLLANCFLILEFCISFSERMRLNLESLKLGYNFQPRFDLQKASKYILSSEDLNKINQATMGALKLELESKDAILAILRLIALITRLEHHEQKSMLLSDSLQDLFILLHRASRLNDMQQFQQFVLHIFHHFYDSNEYLKNLMKTSIIKWFQGQGRVRNVMTSAFTRDHAHLAIKSPTIFISAVVELCKFVKFDIKASDHLITLKNADLAKKKSYEDESGTEDTHIFDTSDNGSLMSFILSEFKNIKENIDPEMNLAEVESLSTNTNIDSKPNKTNFSFEKFPNFVYKCFLLQVMSEIVYCSENAKIEFFKVTRKHHGKEVISSSKSKSSFIWYLLNDLLPYGKIQLSNNVQLQMKFALSNLAMTFIISLCSASKEYDYDMKKLSFVHKHVLDLILKAKKDVFFSNEPQEQRYCRLQVLSELCYRLLTTNGILSGTNQAGDPEIQNRITLLMLEKNFVSVLTTSITEIDLNFPNANKILKQILRPLRILTKNAALLPNTMTPASNEDKNVFEESTDTSLSDEDIFGDREETPDLYRNSALGMIRGDIADQVDSSNEYEDEEDYEDDELEYEDEDEDDGASAVSAEDDTIDIRRSSENLDIEVVLGDNIDQNQTHSEMDVDDENEEEEEEEEDDDDDDDNIVESLDEDLSNPESFDISVIDENEEDYEDSGWQTESSLEDAEVDNQQEQPHRSTISTLDVDLRAIDQDDLFPGDYLSRDDFEDEDDIEELEDDDEIDSEDNFFREELQRDALRLNIASSRNRDRTLNPSIDGAIPLFDLMSRSRPGTQLSSRTLTFNSRDDTNHPLLTNSNEMRTSIRSRIIPVTTTHGFSDWVQSMEQLIGGGAAQLLGDVMTRVRDLRSGPLNPSIRVEVTDRSNEVTQREIDQMIGTRRSNAGTRRQQIRQNRLAIIENDFEIYSYSHRLKQETKALFGVRWLEEARHLMITRIIAALKDLGIKDEIIRREQEAKSREARQKYEEARKRKLEEERLAKEASKQQAELADAYNENNSGNAQHNFERITIQIRGRDVDITDLGVDKNFLEAIPEDIREEVLTQQIQELRAREAYQNANTEINQEFLDVLPPEVREEILIQENIERRLRERAAEANENTLNLENDIEDESPQGRVSFLNSEDGLVALEQYGRDAAPLVANPTAVQGDKGEDVKEKMKKRSSAHLLDKVEIATLIRLIFLPQMLSGKNTLYDILLNLCDNRQSRAEIISFLLLILQNGSIDLQSLERTFAQMSGKARNTFLTPNSHSAKKYKDLHSVNLSNLPKLRYISIPMLLQQSIDALEHLVSWNEHLPAYFLTGHDTFLNLKKFFNRKSKGKDSSKVLRCPLNTLLQLLQNKKIVENSNAIEKLLQILSIVTRPLLILNKIRNEQEKEELKPETSKSMKTALKSKGKLKETDGLELQLKGSTKKRHIEPPDVPVENCKPLVQILTIGDCTSKTFQCILASMFHLCAIPGLRKVFVENLLTEARQYSVLLLDDLAILKQQVSNLTGSEIAHSKALLKISAANSNQTKLLRILKAMQYLFEKTKDSILNYEEERKIYSELSFEELCKGLSECLKEIEQSEISYVANILLPLIESLMVICETSMKADKTNKSELIGTASVEATLVSFTEIHRKTLNQMVRSNPSLMSGSFAILVKNPKVLDFDNKRNYLTRKLHEKTRKKQFQPISINVRRDQVFFDSYRSLYFKSGDEFKYSKLNIKFYGEEGVDAGGVAREWYSVLARQMFNPGYALFSPVVSDRTTFHPNRMSSVNPDHLSFFKFVGRIIGKALFDGRLLDAHFSRAVYKQILGKKATLKDIESLDIEYYNSLVWMLNNDITDVMTETFSINAENFGQQEVIDLVPNGRNLAVIEENKHEYVRLIVEYRLHESVKEQLDSFLKGFHDIIPPNLISIFNEQELELLISGLPDIDIDDWRNNTIYTNYNLSSPQVQWFWRAVRSFDKEERAKLLQFATGTAKVPLDGFANLEGMSGIQKFSLHKDPSSPTRLPQSHTCFNQIDLPEYESYEQLRAQLLTAINEGSEGFGYA